MSYITILLTIPAPFKGGNDWVTFIATFDIADREKGGVRNIKLSVHRKPDKHSFRFAEWADQHKADPSRPAQFPEATITFSETENGMPIKSKYFDFVDLKVIGFLPGGDRETIEFSVAKYSIFEIGKVEVFFD